ncbi:MAG: efflux RND transporter periplasmic adaptor subunit [Ignavibacteriales bacterium]|nr:efflux RND transporter periplasmic adaptor subunit [Ignavibacteriales bacterium]MBI3787602.1 efflux RND transporter periplasmic adaptor subunit [Ignavibacteriales bacterium]
MKQIMYITAVIFSVFVLIGCNGKHAGAIEASGTLEATEVKVSAKVPGQIQRLLIQEGSQVKKGDTLLVLDRSTLELQWKQTQAGVELADAQYRLLLNGARPEDVRLAEEALKQAESSFKNASDDYSRMKELFASNTVSKKQFDDAESRYTVVQAQLNSAKQNLQKMQRFARTEDLAAAKARLDQAKASADLLKKQYTDACVLAPVEGTITNKPVEEGELIGTGTTVATISRLEKMNLMIYVSETELGKVKLGGAADVVIDTYPDKNYPGKIIYISPIAEFTPKNIQTKEDRTKLVFGVKLEVGNNDGTLKSGMPADAFIR